MPANTGIEAQLQTEIEVLRGQFPNTQDLYREVCALLFFRHGITPTANRLYQLVRKGSMSAPAEALSKFWVELREKSRIRVEHPDLPEDLRTAAGELTATLWSKAQANAQEGFAVFRSEANAAVLEARAAQTSAEADRAKARSDANAIQASLSAANETIRDVERQLAAQGATRASLELQLLQAGQEIEILRAALEEARHEFTVELDKNRADTKLAEVRFQAAEQRALREIDRERTQAAKLQKELDQVRAAASQAADRHQAETTTLHNEVGELRQRIGVLEGNLQSSNAERDRISADSEVLRQQITEAASQAAAYRADAENWKCRAEDSLRSINDLKIKAARRPRKATPDKS